MIFLTQTLLIISILLALCYHRIPLKQSLIILGATLVVMSMSGQTPWVWWIVFIACAAILANPAIRRDRISHAVLQQLRVSIPKLSQHELEALRAGHAWWDAELMNGNPSLSLMSQLPGPKLTEEEQYFLDNQTETLCEMIDDWEIGKQRDLSPKVWDYLKQERFFGMIIPKQYGGLAFSGRGHSAVVTKIATRSLSAAVTAMVPNSLGPAELLLHYGTEQQKTHYLPRLARGEDIPCFALTNPEAGSDASSIPDRGIVCKRVFEGQEIIGIALSWEKRYITLAPVATLLGLAFHLYDPDNLLGEQEDIGITLCLIPTNHPGVEIGHRHLPMQGGFMNGPTRGHDVFIPLDWIIGGVTQAGQGWKMLMECLSIGRAISLPAVASACAKVAYRMTGAYARIREQFRLPIGYFEGVQEVLARIAGHTYMIEAVRVLTAGAVARGIKPTVASAIAKYHLTELGRATVNDAMDIHAGRGLIMGPRNYLAMSYINMPISITVEGSNILTRNLIIFGQGGVRNHRFILKEMQLAHAEDNRETLVAFDETFWQHVRHIAGNFSRALFLGLSHSHLTATRKRGEMMRYYQHLSRMSAALAFITDVTFAILGGNLKRKERLSARLGDVLSYLYIASAVLNLYEKHHRPKDEALHVHWAMQTCFYRIQQAFVEFFTNFPVRWLAVCLKRLVLPYGPCFKCPNDHLEHQLAHSMLEHNSARERLTQPCYVPHDSQDVMGRVENAFLRVLSAEPALQKLRQAGIHLRAHDRESKLEHALAEGIITHEEASLIAAAEQARWDAIQVDEF